MADLQVSGTALINNNKDYETEKKVSLDELNQPHLIQNEQFLELKQVLEILYQNDLKEVMSYFPNSTKEWRQAIYRSLLPLLYEVARTQDQVQQIELLEKVYKWYIERQPKPRKVRDKSIESTNDSMQRSFIIESPRITNSPQVRHSQSPNISPKLITKSNLPDEPQREHIKRNQRLEDLKPKVMPFTTYNSLSSDPQLEERINNRLLQARIREQQVFKQKLTRNKVLREASRQSQRRQEETFRKIEQARLPSIEPKHKERPSIIKEIPNTLDLRKKLNPVSNQPERVYESDSDEEIPFKYNPIVQRVRQLHSSLIGVKERGQRGLDFKGNSLSVYRESREGSRDIVVLTRSTPEPRNRYREFSEIVDIKRKCARWGLRLPMQSLQLGLVVPDDLDLEETNYGFPDIGDRLLNRPKLKSTKEGKKKKKSKGKKRR